jgi:hypothetical protein
VLRRRIVAHEPNPHMQRRLDAWGFEGGPAHAELRAAPPRDCLRQARGRVGVSDVEGFVAARLNHSLSGSTHPAIGTRPRDDATADFMGVTAQAVE